MPFDSVVNAPLNKFLILGFRCEQEEVLGFQGRTFSPVFS